MIRVVQQGAAWSVVRDGRLIREGAGAAVHKTRELAEQHAMRLAEKLREEVQVPGREEVQVPGPDASTDSGELGT